MVGLRGLEPRTSTLSVSRSNHLSYKPDYACHRTCSRYGFVGRCPLYKVSPSKYFEYIRLIADLNQSRLGFLDALFFPLIKRKASEHLIQDLQKGGVPAAPSGTATLLRLSPSHRFYPKQRLSTTGFRSSRLPWLDGRCVQGPGTYSPYQC